MSERENRGNEVERRLAEIKREIFDVATKQLQNGIYCPPKGDFEAEYVAYPKQQLGEFASFTTTASSINDPQEIRCDWYRRDRRRAMELVLSPGEIKVQYFAYDDNSDKYPITDIEPIHPEALMELYEKMLTPENE